MNWIESGNKEMLKVDGHYVGCVMPNPAHKIRWMWWVFPPVKARIKADSPKGRAISRADAKRVVVAILIAAGAVDSRQVSAMDFMAGWGEGK